MKRRKMVLVLTGARPTAMGIGGSLAEGDAQAIDVSVMKKSFLDVMDALRDIIPQADAPNSGLGLKSLDVELGLDAKGKIAILGTGVEVGARAALKLHFERR